MLGQRTFRMLGGRGKAVLPDVDTSSFEGAELGLVGIESESEAPPRTLTANVSMWPRAVVIVMNSDAYEGLSEEQRETLRAAGRAAIDPALRRIESRDREALDILCRRGDVAVPSAAPEQLAALREAVEPLTRQVEEAEETGEVARRIAAMRAELGPAPALRCEAGEAPQRERAGTRLDGVWRSVTSPDDLKSAGAPAGDVAAENWGEWLYVFVNGRFAHTQQNAQACTYGSGSFAVKGDILELSYEDGGGLAPNGAMNRPGEFMRFHWSRFHDTVTLEPVEGAISPENYRARPWQRVDEEPTRAALHADCLPKADALRP